MKKHFKVFIFLAGGFFVVTLIAGIFALNPRDLDSKEVAAPKFVVHAPPPPQNEEPPPPPPEPSQAASLLAALAPDSFSQTADLGAGVGFGSGGSGLAVGGGGGFGTDTSSLVGEKTSVDRPPRAIFKSPPEYPSEARSRGVSGFVVVKLLIAASGAIEKASVESSEPPGFFDQAALSAVKNWRFEPAITGGKTAAAWTMQKISFELN